MGGKFHCFPLICLPFISAIILNYSLDDAIWELNVYSGEPTESRAENLGD
jgi:hypothetical protein